MTTATATLADFLLARLSDDEAVARAALHLSRESWWVDGPAATSGKHWVYATGEKFADVEVADHIARHDPARVLADCAARRAIVELHSAYPTPQQMAYGTITACSECGSVDDSPVEWPCLTLRHLAAPYASSPGFDPAWAVS